MADKLLKRVCPTFRDCSSFYCITISVYTTLLVKKSLKMSGIRRGAPMLLRFFCYDECILKNCQIKKLILYYNVRNWIPAFRYSCPISTNNIGIVMCRKKVCTLWVPHNVVCRKWVFPTFLPKNQVKTKQIFSTKD